MADNPVLTSSPAYLATAYDIVPIIPSDTVDLPIAARAIRCNSVTGAAGTLRITTLNGQVRNTQIDAGELLLIGAKRVHATGTAATGLEALL